MKLFFFSAHTDVHEFVFARDQERATELFVLKLIKDGLPPSNFWSREFTTEMVVEAHREHLREALERGLEGLGEYDEMEGWQVLSLW